MSYQIKSTPYFRRMFNNSKKNGQLQRLREEYERIQEFNDRTIELKMRQVRLKRLFREIEEIKDGGIAGNQLTSTKNSHGGSHSPPPPQAGRNLRRINHHARMSKITPEQRIHEQRVETLARARELGKEISRRNGEMVEAGAGGFLRSEIRLTAKMQAAADVRKDAVDRRERAAKRISYGNDQSRQNLQRLLLVRQRRLCGGHAQMVVNRPQHLQPDSQVPVTQQLPRKEIRPSHLYPDYRQLTASQMQLLKAEKEQTVEEQRRLRDQEEDQQLLQELHYQRLKQQRRQEDFSEDDLQRQDSPLSMQNNVANSEEQMIQLRIQNPDLVDELERRRQRQQEDEDEEKQLQMRLRHLHEDTSPLRLPRFSLSSTLTEATNATNVTVETAATSPMNVRRRYNKNGSLDSDLEIHTAPPALPDDRIGLCSCFATISSHQPTQGVPHNQYYDYVHEQDSMSATKKWRQVSLMLPWMKAFPDAKTDAPVAQPSVGGLSINASDYEMAPECGINPMYSYQTSDSANQAEEKPFLPPNSEYLISTLKFVETTER
ncbi:trichohyalin [Drosophila eugracilis]|uniref:trichohyalin n=1 Tax=Drosophila eugracilis TaxID=29029 RepID=UPI0007E5D85D|nr:trichohyalin [Drosophila eugracilis]